MLALAAFLLASGISAQRLAGEWPANLASPAGNEAWTYHILGDGSAIPNLPVRTTNAPWDTTGEVINCQGNPTHWALTFDDGPG